MLVLTRKTDDSIHIGDDIVVTVLDVDGRAVKIGIDAPKKITILRGEVKRQIEEENIIAASKSRHRSSLKHLRSFMDNS